MGSRCKIREFGSCFNQQIELFDWRYIPRIRTSKWWTCILNYTLRNYRCTVYCLYIGWHYKNENRTIFVERNHNISYCYTLEIIFLFGNNVLGNYFALLTKGKIQYLWASLDVLFFLWIFLLFQLKIVKLKNIAF